MILPDTNLLVYAHNEASRFHRRAKQWWIGLLGGDEPVALCWATVMGFVRIVTHPGIQSNPMAVEDSLEIVDSWLKYPHLHWLHPGRQHYTLFRSLLGGIGVGGNLVTDAHLAALAIEHQCELHSNDADFASFSGLRWVNPLS
jgi:toxin-antitoxin system PIN domain toxin